MISQAMMWVSYSSERSKYLRNCHQSENNGIYPTHDGARNRAFCLLPPSPTDVFGNIDIVNERQENDSPPTFYPKQKRQVQHHHDAHLYPIHRGGVMFDSFHHIYYELLKTETNHPSRASPHVLQYILLQAQHLTQIPYDYEHHE